MKRYTEMLMVLVLLMALASASATQDMRMPATTAPGAPASEKRAPDTKPPAPVAHPAVVAKVRELSAKEPVTVAAAAYWLGEQGSAAIEAIPPLAAVLGDSRPVNPARYRKHTPARVPRSEASSPGEEAAVALSKIGDPAVEALINVLKTSPSAVARQNAAWALGVIQERHNPKAVLSSSDPRDEGNR